MGLKRLLAERKQENQVDRSVDPALTFESTKESTEGVEIGGRVDFSTKLTNSPQDLETSGIPCNRSDCASLSRDPADCEACALVVWVDHAEPGDSWRLPAAWMPDAVELQRAADSRIRRRNARLRIWLDGRDRVLVVKALLAPPSQKFQVL